ncbi:SLOG family protein [Intestinimonas timonensis]|uniref:SLOG family protein n=1 Tax=Intestinimonas timonensis TaxID=1689270 RepID=UPI003A8E2755
MRRAYAKIFYQRILRDSSFLHSHPQFFIRNHDALAPFYLNINRTWYIIILTKIGYSYERGELQVNEKICCVTGHRDIPEKRIDYVKQALRHEILSALEDGYTRFISGFAEGVDLMFASIVAEEKRQHPELFLEAAIPYAGKLKTKNQQFHELLRACDGVKVECEKYVPSCFMQRNRYMVHQSQLVIAVYDGRDHGGTLFTMRCAHTLGKEVHLIKV